MTELERISDQLHRAHHGDAWHGPSLLEILKDITATQAASKPLAGAHSIWELALHIGAWERAGVRRVRGERAELSDIEDWPTVGEVTEEAWQLCKARLTHGADELRKAIASVDESRLDQPILDGMPTVYVTLHGIVQHSLYHAGQIAILKKAIIGG